MIMGDDDDVDEYEETATTNVVHRRNECDDDRLVQCVSRLISLNPKHAKGGLCQIVLRFVVHDRLHAVVELLDTRMVGVSGAAIYVFILSYRQSSNSPCHFRIR